MPGMIMANAAWRGGDAAITDFANQFDALEDPRAGNARRYSCHDTLLIAFCTMLCSGQACTDMELFGRAKRELLQSFLPLENDIPCHDTLHYILAALEDTGALGLPAVVRGL